MNEENNNENIQTPSFEGEKMKMPENSDVQLSQPAERSSVVNAPVLIILTILLLAILGGMYFWFTTLTEPTPEPLPPVERPTPLENNEPESTTAESQADMMNVTSPSDAIEAIEADIEATDLDSLDAELEAIDAELDAALNEI